MIFLLTACVMAGLLTTAGFRWGQHWYLTILKVCCVTLVVEWLLLLIPARELRSSYAGTQGLFWINLVAMIMTTLVLAWLATANLMARDPD